MSARFAAAGLVCMLLGACSSVDDAHGVDTSGLDPSHIASPVQFDGKDDKGRLMIKGEPLWQRHVGVASTNKSVEKAAKKLVQLNYSVNVMKALCDSELVVHVNSLSSETQIGLNFTVKYRGQTYKSLPHFAKDDCDGGDTDCTESRTRESHELAFFKLKGTQNAFLDFLDQTFDTIKSRKLEAKK